jgi:methylated-DNA-[protein]-cysteine S-methyltransferase
MEELSGSARLGLWFVHVRWSGTTVFQVRFSKNPLPGPVPPLIRQYLAGRPVDLTSLDVGTSPPGEHFASIYREVRKIPYGSTTTYGEVADRAGTVPRVVGQAMRRNPVPLVIPCHRVVSRSGMGGFTPDPEIKALLLDMERKNRRRFTGTGKRSSPAGDRDGEGEGGFGDTSEP